MSKRRDYCLRLSQPSNTVTMRHPLKHYTQLIIQCLLISSHSAAPYYLVVGISGVTNGGKSTLARHIQNHFELGKVTLLSLDDYFIKDTSRLEYLEPLKRYNYDQMKSVDWDLFYQDAQEIIYGYER